MNPHKHDITTNPSELLELVALLHDIKHLLLEIKTTTVSIQTIASECNVTLQEIEENQ